MTDPIADFLTRIRNAQSAKHRVVEIPSSNLKKAITLVLQDKGYILSHKFEDNGPKSLIKIALKYHPVSKIPAIKSIQRISSPGLRRYCGVDSIPRVLNGLGVAIMSTPKGVISDKEARQLKVGGEVLCYVY